LEIREDAGGKRAFGKTPVAHGSTVYMELSKLGQKNYLKKCH